MVSQSKLNNEISFSDTYLIWILFYFSFFVKKRKKKLAKSLRHSVKPNSVLGLKKKRKKENIGIGVNYVNGQMVDVGHGKTITPSDGMENKRKKKHFDTKKKPTTTIHDACKPL